MKEDSDNNGSSVNKESKEDYDSEGHCIFYHYAPYLSQELNPWLVELDMTLKHNKINNKEIIYFCIVTLQLYFLDIPV